MSCDLAVRLESEAVVLGWDADEFLETMIEVTDGVGEPLYQKIINTCADNFLSLTDLFKVVEKKVKDREASEKAEIVEVANDSERVKAFHQMTEAEREQYLAQQELKEQQGWGDYGYGG